MKAILTDTTKCVGCFECQHACKQVNRLPNDVTYRWVGEDGLSSTAWTTVLRHPSGELVRKQCRHCLQPACASACPVGALHTTTLGAVVYEAHKCLGCRYCMMACPYKARSFVHEPLTGQNPDVPRGKGTVESCTLCVHRIDVGGKPACSEACPNKAIVFGDLNDENSEIAQKVRSVATVQVRADLRLNPGVRYQGI